MPDSNSSPAQKVVCRPRAYSLCVPEKLHKHGPQQYSSVLLRNPFTCLFGNKLGGSPCTPRTTLVASLL